MPGDLLPVALLGQVVLHDLILLRLDKHLLDAEALILGNREVADPVLVDKFLGAVDDALHEVDRHALVGGQVGVAVDGKEEVPAVVVRVNDGTYTSRFERYFAANAAAVTFCLAASITASTIFSFCLKLLNLHQPLRGLGRQESLPRHRDSYK